MATSFAELAEQCEKSIGGGGHIADLEAKPTERLSARDLSGGLRAQGRMHLYKASQLLPRSLMGCEKNGVCGGDRLLSKVQPQSPLCAVVH
jgi:hypothetical protein